MRKQVAILVLVFLSCNVQKAGLAGNRNTAFGNATLVSEFRNVPEKVAVVHVLFVPDDDVPSGFVAKVNAYAGAPSSSRFRFERYDPRKNVRVHAEVTVKDVATVHGGGQSFQLANGNLFVAEVSRDSRVQLFQIPHVIRDAAEPPDSILSAIQANSPRDARVQTVAASRT